MGEIDHLAEIGVYELIQMTRLAGVEEEELGR